MQVRFCLMDVDYVLDDNNRPVVRIWGINKQGKSIVALDNSFRSYFYIQPRAVLGRTEIKELMRRVSELKIGEQVPEKIEEVERRILGKKTRVLKVTITNPRDIPKFRDLVKEWPDVREEYEYGISFYKRYLIDKGLVPMGWVEAEGPVDGSSGLDVDLVLKAEKIKTVDISGFPPFKIMAFDIEVTEEGGEEKIIMISLKDNRGFEKVLTYKKTRARGVTTVKDEASLLGRFVQVIRERNPDIICGYNTDRFDFLKLDARAEKYKTPLKLGKNGKGIIFRRRGRISSAKIAGRVHIDLYDFVEHILAQTLTSDVLTLDRVSREILGMGKKTMKWKEIEQIWKGRRGLKKLVEYCRWDSELALKLAYHLLPQMYELCKVTSQLLFDVSRMTYSQLVESVLIREAYRAGELAQNRPKYDEVQRRRAAEPYAGAYVHLPKEGIHDNIAVFDFRSLYPSIIVSHNISPETLDCGHRACKRNRAPELQHYFCTKRKGFIPTILERIIKKRTEVQRQMARMAKTPRYKELFNRQFGLKILANSFYGYYGYAGSRWYSRVCARCITAWGRYYIKNVIKMAERAGFEVLYGDTDSLFLKIKSKAKAMSFLKDVNKRLPGIMELEFKGVYTRGIFIEAKTGIAAKKKYALLDEKGNLIMRGMETRRRDWAKIAKDTQERVLEAVLKGKSVEKAVDIVNQTVRAIRKGQVDLDDLVIYTQITRPLSQYEQLGPHVKAARKALQRGRPVGEGSVIAYIITRGAGSISDRAEPAEDARNYDPQYYIYHQVVPSALRILAGLGVREQELLRGTKKLYTLQSFFKKRR